MGRVSVDALTQSRLNVIDIELAHTSTLVLASLHSFWGPDQSEIPENVAAGDCAFRICETRSFLMPLSWIHEDAIQMRLMVRLGLQRMKLSSLYHLYD